MADPYPFKGIWRWVVLPSLLALAGTLGGLAGGCAGGAGASDLAYWLIVGFVKAAVEGGALALGKRPMVALSAAMVLGGLSVWVEQGLMDAAFGGAGVVDARPGTILGFGGVASLMVVSHHVYLRARRRGPRTAWAAGLLYPASAVAGMGGFVYLIYPHNRALGSDLVLWGVAEGLLAWLALVVAARLSERTTPSAAVQ